MNDRRYINYKVNKPKFNELNYIISNYFKSEVEQEQKLDNLLKDISRVKSIFKTSDKKRNSPKRNNVNSPTFGSKRPKSVDDINYKNSPNNSMVNSNINSNSNTVDLNKKIICYKRPRNYINNRSFDNIKYTRKELYNNRYTNENSKLYDNNTYSQNSFSNYNSNLMYPGYSTKSGQNISNNNTPKGTPNLDKDNSFKNIFEKIPTNIYRINKNNNQSLENSSENSLINYNSINYNPIIYQKQNYVNNNYLGYNSTFYNQKNLSIEMDKNYSINNTTKKKNDTNKTKIDKANQRIYYKTPILKNKLKHKKKYIRKISDDYYTSNKNNIVINMLNNGCNKNEIYFSTMNTNSQTNSSKNSEQLISNKYEKIYTTKVNRYKDFLNAIESRNSFKFLKSSNINNYSTIKSDKNNLKNCNQKALNHKKLSSYILKNENKSKSRKYETKSYDNSVFKQKIKLVKRKKRPKRLRRNKTFDEVFDKPSATPIKKENDKGGKIELYDKNYRTVNNKEISNTIFNHQININIRNIKSNLKKIKLIQKWWKSILQSKLKNKSIYLSYNSYLPNNKIIKRKKPMNLNKNEKINFYTKKRYLSKEKNISESIDINDTNENRDINQDKDKDNLIMKRIVPKIYYMSKEYHENKNSKVIFLQKYLKQKLLTKNRNYFCNIIKPVCYLDKIRLNSINNFKTFDISKLSKSLANKLYFGQNESGCKLDNISYHSQNSKTIKENYDKNIKIKSMPLTKNCFISKMIYNKKNLIKIKSNKYKITSESKTEYLKVPKKKTPYEIKSIFKEHILPTPRKKNSLIIEKIEISNITDNNINYNNNIQFPKIPICHISKEALINIKNKREIIKYPLNEKCEYISKLKKNKDKINSIIFLQKYILKYLNNKRDNNKILINFISKPTLLNCYLSKIYINNLNNNIEKIKYIQKKFRQYQENNNNVNNNPKFNINYNNKNSTSINGIKSNSSNYNTSQRSEMSQDTKSGNKDDQNAMKLLFQKSINHKQKIFDLIQMLEQKVSKNINQYVFYKIKNYNIEKRNKNIFFSIIKRIINIYNKISNSKEELSNNNDFIKFINDNLSKNIYDLNKFNYLSFIPKNEENNLIETQLFQKNDKQLAIFICTCIKLEHNFIISDDINNLIQHRLMKEPLKDNNIFTIIRYSDALYDNIINKNICNKCFCKKFEKCGNNCQCHDSNLKSDVRFKKVKFTSQPKIKTYSSSLNYSFDEINSIHNKSKNLSKCNDDYEIISNVLLYDRIFKRNIYYTITKVDKLNNSMDDSQSEIDVFQKMNKGTESLIKKAMINKAFEDYNKEKMNNMNIFGNNQDISKIIKSFTSELIEILRNNDNLREVGIRGDCVYAIYTTPTQKDDDELFTLACYCNTYLIMLNELLAEYNLPSIKAGIGLATSKLLVIKAGRKHVGINDKIWIGNAVVDASNFSSIANRKGYRSIVMSVPFYKNIIKYEKDIKENLVKAESDYGDCYMGNIIITDFKNWIKNGMKN
mgnify:CR=1 FL=1